MDIDRKKAEIGQSLKEIREDNGISKYKLREDHGVSGHFAQNVELGQTNYTIDRLLEYCELIGADITITRRD